MEIKVECPWCNQEYSVDESLIGKNVECSVCEKDFIVRKTRESFSDTNKATDNHSLPQIKCFDQNKMRGQTEAGKKYVRSIIVFSAALILVLILFSVIICGKIISEKEYKRGLEAYNEHRYEEAVEHFQKAIKRGHSTAQIEYKKTLAEIDYIKGQKAYNEKKYEEAVVFFQKAFEQGYQKAETELDKAKSEISYKNGRKAYNEHRYEDASSFFQNAAELGHEKAQLEYQKTLGVINYNEGRKAIDEHHYEKAVTFLQKAAENGHAKAQLTLGICYYNGDGIKRDNDEAVKWFRKAAEQNNPEAQFRIGLCYLAGIGVNPREEEAIYWLEKAAEQGHYNAQLNLGDCYYKTDNLTGYKKALFWYAQAAGTGIEDRKEESLFCLLFIKASEGDSESQLKMFSCYNKGLYGIKQDNAQAVSWLQKSADSGNAEAQFLLGSYYHLGEEGLKKDDTEAKKWLRKAAIQDYSNANFALYTLIFSEIGFEGKETIKKYQAEAVKGDYDAMVRLGDCYLVGFEVEKDIQKAFRLYKESEEVQKRNR